MSGLEGLVALSLACNILQVIEFTLKIAAKTQEIDGNASSQTDANEVIRNVALDLDSRCSLLTASLGQCHQLPTAEKRHDDDRLEQIGSLCQAKARDLVNLLNRLAPSRPDSRMSRLAAALRTVKESDQIAAIQAHMREYRSQTEYIMTQSNYESLRKVSSSLDALHEDQAAKHGLLLEAIHSSDKQVQSAIRQSSTQWHAHTDLVISSINRKADEIMSRVPAAGPPAYSEHDGPARPPGSSEIHEKVQAGDVGAVKLIAKRDPLSVREQRDDDRRTPLHIAASMGNDELVAYLLKQGADPNKDDIDDATPLHLAVKADSALSVRHLCSYGADPSQQDFTHKSPLDYAMNNTEIAWILRNGPDIDVKNKQGQTALVHFVKVNNRRAVESLLLQGASVSPSDGWALHLAARYGFREMVQLLIDHDFPLDARDPADQATALHEAAVHRKPRIAEALVLAGADIDPQKNNGRTPLLEALFHNHTDLAIRLIKAGADVDIATGRGFAPIHVASMLGLTAAVAEILGRSDCSANRRGHLNYTALAEASAHGHEDVVELLLAHDADTDLRCDHVMSSPLHLACLHGHVGVIRRLIEKGGANVEARTNEGKTPLLEAAFAAHIDAVREMLRHGADANAAEQVRGCYSSLDFATCGNRHELMRTLVLEGGADVNARASKIGRTALVMAVQNKSLDSVKLLLDLGADPNLADMDPSHQFANHGRGMRYPPVSLAVLTESQDMLELLVDHGKAKVDSTNHKGWTALHEAVNNGNVKAIRFLLSRGADRDLKAPAFGSYLTPVELAKTTRKEQRAVIVEMLRQEYLGTRTANG